MRHPRSPARRRTTARRFAATATPRSRRPRARRRRRRLNLHLMDARAPLQPPLAAVLISDFGRNRRLPGIAVKPFNQGRITLGDEAATHLLRARQLAVV